MTEIRSTEQLIEQYQYTKAAYSKASEALRNRAIEESGFKVGDILKYVCDGKSRDKDNEHIISRLVGKIDEGWTAQPIKLSVKAWTRKRLKSGGFHATENERYELQSKPRYKGEGYWEVIGHEELGTKGLEVI